jgi:hypothetical protein
MRDVLHPSVQVGQYKTYLQDSHTAFHPGSGLTLNACCYLHNCGYDPADVTFSEKFKDAFRAFFADSTPGSNPTPVPFHEVMVELITGVSTGGK